MQRIFPAIRVAGNRFRMADMVRPARKQKSFQRMVDTRITIVGNRTAGSDISVVNKAFSDIQNRALVELKLRSEGRRKGFHPHFLLMLTTRLPKVSGI
ncbi:hypothetical protein D3C87_1609820 [compost metagenome]